MDLFEVGFALWGSVAFLAIYFCVSHSFWEDKKKWRTFTDLYKLHRVDSENMFCGRALVGVFSLTEYILWHISRILSNGKMFYVGGIVKNGYLLVCLSPLVLVWEAIVSLGWLILTIIWLVIFVVALPFVILTALWAIVFELPADALNMKREQAKPQKRVRRRQTRKAKVIGELGVEKDNTK